MENLYSGVIILQKFQLIKRLKFKGAFESWLVEELSSGVEIELLFCADRYLVINKFYQEFFYWVYPVQDILTSKFSDLRIFDNKYILLQFIAEGGYAHVWKGVYTHTGDLVALKIFNDLDKVSGNEIKTEYRPELKHNNLIIPTHMDYSDEGVFYYIMKFCNAEGATNILEATSGTCTLLSGKLDENLIAKLILDISDAFIYLKNQRIVHNDIKPSNLLYDVNYNDGNHGENRKLWRFFISDIGISKQASSSISTRINLKNTQREGNKVRGKEHIFGRAPIQFTPPEVAKGYESTFASDIWAFGVSLYFLIEEVLPFGDFGGSSQKNGRKGMPSTISKVTNDLNLIIMACMHWNPGDRLLPEQLHSMASSYLNSNDIQPNWLTHQERNLIKKKLKIERIESSEIVNTIQNKFKVMFKGINISFTTIIVIIAIACAIVFLYILSNSLSENNTSSDKPEGRQNTIDQDQSQGYCFDYSTFELFNQ